jgi:hypothetical protein
MKKEIKIFNYAWHIGHQWELMKIPNTRWFHIENNIKQWKTSNRPIPENLTMVKHYEPGRYDLAVLHIDQQCLFGHSKGIPYKMLNAQIQDIPKIVINHGTPHYQNFDPELIKQKMREAIGDNIMVVNSHQAREEWGFGEVIIHGLDPNEWIDSPLKENLIFTTVSPGTIDINDDGWAEYYNRRTFQEVKKEIDITHIGSDVTFESWTDYKNFIGHSLIYFNPTLHSPMPRARTEAMLSGACVVTTRHHDADRFIVDGENGFLCDSKDEMVQRLIWLRCNPTEAKKIGQAGKKTALDLFSMKRFQLEWRDLIQRAIDCDFLRTEMQRLKSEIVSVFELCGATGVNYERVTEVLLRDHNRKMMAKFGKNWDK